MKLHLGCGQVYLPGYINIDYPQDHQSIQHIKADKYIDVTKLKYRANSISEIRLHHVFEHFDRQTALALLCRWRNWLTTDGLLRIETPDAMASYKLMTSPIISFSDKQQVMRHLQGSHEAEWAVHWDGWYKEKYDYTLGKLGFKNITFKYNKWGMLRNIEVFAHKNNIKYLRTDYRRNCLELLKLSTIKVNTKNKNEPEGTEQEMLGYWMSEWDKIYNKK